MTIATLVLAVLFEVGWALGLRKSEWLSRPGWAAFTLVCYALALLCLIPAAKRLGIGPAYAIWAGAGTALIALGGRALFADPISGVRWIFIALIVAGVVGLNLTEKHQPAPQGAARP